MRDSNQIPQSERGIGQGAQEKSRVLVVDDDARFLFTMDAILSEHVDVVTSTSAERALRLLSSNRYDLVCSDFEMPGLDGIDFLARVASLPFFVSTLLITGSERYIRAARSTHQYYVLLKPFDPQRLISLVLQLTHLTCMKRSVRSLKESVPPSQPPPPLSTREGNAPPSSLRWRQG